MSGIAFLPPAEIPSRRQAVVILASYDPLYLARRAEESPAHFERLLDDVLPVNRLPEEIERAMEDPERFDGMS